MGMLTRDAFEIWLQAYRAAWESRDAHAAAALCSLLRALSTTGRRSILRSEGAMKLPRHGRAQ